MSDAAESTTESAPPRETYAAPEAAVRLREVLGRMPDYKPGKAASAPPGVSAYKLSSNENPYGPLPSVLAAIGDGATTINRYPDMAVTALTQRLARALDVPPECIATGTGSVAVLAQIISAACDAGDEVIFAWRSFEAYPIATQVAGASPVMVGLDEQARHRLGAMFAAITDRTRVILVCTPNNPTGPCVGHAELEAFLDKVPSDVIVVIDEAYVEFVRDPEAVRGLDVWRHRPNVVVLRTFSKAYGLAGLRVGMPSRTLPSLLPSARPQRPSASTRSRRSLPSRRSMPSTSSRSGWTPLSRSASGSCRPSSTRAGSCPGPMPTSCGSPSVPTPPPLRMRARRRVSWCGSTATTACG